MFTLQTVPAVGSADDNSSVAKAAGFSLHAGVASEAHEREKLERVCRTITRPAVSTERLSLTTQGNIRYCLKTPYRDGTTDVVFEPLDKIAWSDFEQPQAGPQGEGQDARSISWPAWPPWCRRHGSTSRAITALMPCIFKCEVGLAASLFSCHFDGFELCITIRCLSAANSLSVALKRPARSVRASADPRVSSFTAASTRV